MHWPDVVEMAVAVVVVEDKEDEEDREDVEAVTLTLALVHTNSSLLLHF